MEINRKVFCKVENRSNNRCVLISGVLISDKALQNLDSALSIRRRQGWANYYTALTLTHIADIHAEMGHLVTAMDYYCQAEEILLLTAKNHDLRLRLNSDLAHISLAIDVKHAETKNSHQSQPHGAWSLTSSSLDGCDENASCPNRSLAGCCRSATGSPADEIDSKESLDRAFFSKKPARHYLRRVYTLAGQMKGTLSDHGHGQLIGSLEHLILLEWGNPAQISKYIRKIEDIRMTYSWVAEQVKRSEQERNPYMDKHDKFFKYISSGEPHFLDLKAVIMLVQTNCQKCRSLVNHFCCSGWEKIIALIQTKRQEVISQLRPFSSEQISSTSSSSESSLPSESEGNPNSIDLYVNANLSDPNVESFEDNSIDSSYSDNERTGRKFCEGTYNNSCVDSGFTYAGVNDMSAPSPASLTDHHRMSVEESSWSFSDSLQLNLSELGIQTTDVQNIARAQICPGPSENISLPSGSDPHLCLWEDTQSGIANNRPGDTSVGDLKENLYLTFAKQSAGHVENGSPLWKSSCSSLGKTETSGCSSWVPAFSMHAHAEACWYDNASNRSDRLTVAESGYASNTNTVCRGIGGKGTEKFWESGGRFSSSTSRELDSGYSRNIRHERIFHHGESCICCPSTSSEEMKCLNGNACVRTDETYSHVSNALCHNSDDRSNNNSNSGNNLGCHLPSTDYAVGTGLSRLTLLDQVAFRDETGCSRHNIITSGGSDLNVTKKCRQPSQQDERDVK